MGALTTIDQFKTFISRIKPSDPDHMLRIAALPAKKTPAEWWINDVSRAKFYWDNDRQKAWSRQWWLDWHGKQPTLCDAKGEIKKVGIVEIFKYLSTYNRNGYGIYVQPNPCLLGDSGQNTALPGRCIFVESDGSTPADSAESRAITAKLADQAMSLSPDLVVTTFKSAHTYRISEVLYPTVGAWQVDQSRFTQAARDVWGAETDESLTDANQLMRLPGFNHCRWSDGRMQFQPVAIAFDSGVKHASIDSDLPELAEPIATKTVGTAHAFTAFELGNFAHLLTGFKESGRKAFNTCKCPAHDGESVDSLHVNKATGQYTCHSGCDSKAVYRAALSEAIAKGYQLPERKQASKEHWAYEENKAGVWVELAEKFTGSIEFKDGEPDLLFLLPAGLKQKVVAAKEISSPAAIALKAYSEFLSRVGHPDYMADAKELIGDAWDWAEIPARVPLWGWKAFFSALSGHADSDSKAELKSFRDGLKSAKAQAKADATRELADRWEMLPKNVEWLDSQYFGDSLVNEVEKAGDQRLLLPVYGATGTGKTNALKAVRAFARENDRQFIYVTVKETLSKAAGRELELTYRTDLDTAEHKVKFPDLSACVASFGENSIGIDWGTQISENAIVAFDESDLIFSVTAGASSSGDSLEIQRVMSSVFQKAQTVILLSAQVKDRHIKLAERLTCADIVKTLGICKAATPKTIYLCDDTDRADDESATEGDDSENQSGKSIKNWVVDHWSQGLRDGKNSLVLSGSMLPDSKLGTMLLEQYVRQEIGISEVLRLDSQSTKDPDNAGFKIAERDYIEVTRNNRTTIASPSCQEGFSLKYGEGAGDSHFDNVYVFDPGSKLPEQLIQDIGRDRHNTETFVSVAPGHSLSKFGGTVEPSEVRRQLKAMASQKESKLIRSACGSDPLNWDNAFLQFYCEDIAQSNAAISDKIYNLQRYLTHVGHTVSIIKGESGDGIPEEFYDRIAGEYQQSVATAGYIDRFDAEELQKKGEYSLDQWLQLRQLQFRSQMRWEIPYICDELTDTVEAKENPMDNGLDIDAAFIRQWSRDRIAKPWQMHYYAQQHEWDWVAHDFKRARFNEKYEISNGGESVENFSPDDVLSLKSRRLSILKELGILDFMNRYTVTTATSEAVEASNTQELAEKLHNAHKESRFTKADLEPITEKLKENFETYCSLLGIKSQRDEDGEVNHRQVLTLIRNVFAVKTYAMKKRNLNGVRGVFLLVSDDKALALRKGLLKSEKAQDDLERIEAVDKAIALYNETHNRTEIFPVWDVHKKVEGKQFRKFLSEKSYKTALLDEDRPEHWEKLSKWVEANTPEIAAPVLAVEPEVIEEPIEEPIEDIVEGKVEDTVEAYGVLMTRLQWCVNIDDYENIRVSLEALGLDFDTDCWSKISIEQRNKIVQMHSEAVTV